MMKKIGTRIIAAFILVGLVSLSARSAVSPREETRQLISNATTQQVFLEKIKAHTGLSVTLSDTVPAIQMLVEPEFTAGETNNVYWDPLPDPVPVNIDGEALNIPLAQCRILPLLWFDNPNDWDLHTTVINGTATSYTFSNEINGQKYYEQDIHYSAALLVNKNPNDTTSTWVASTSRTVVFSKPDSTRPTLDSLVITDANDNPGLNGWFRTTNIKINYYGLSDIAGLYSAFITGDLLASTNLYPSTPDGTPGSTVIENGFFPFTLTPGEHDFSFGAQNSAYTPISHGPGAGLSAVWDPRGNRNNSITSGAVRIDTQAPEIDLSPIKSVYSSADVKGGVIADTFFVSDALSGVDVNSITAVLNPDMAMRLYERTCQDTGCNRAQVLFDIQRPTHATAVLTVTALDMAGNSVSMQKTIDFRLEPPKLVDYRITDMDYTGGSSPCIQPAVNFTNSPTIRLDNFSFQGEAADFLRIIGRDDSLTVPYQPLFEFDISPVMGDILPYLPQCLAIKAIDSLGNTQEEGITRCIRFDDQPPTITLAVQDTSDWENGTPGKYGAYPGWTNGANVHVTIASADTDLYKIEELAPTPTCRNASELDFDWFFPTLDEKKWKFDFQACDSAGNTAHPDTVSIFLDRTIAPITEADVTVAYVYRDGVQVDSVKIVFWAKDAIPDLSRLIINDTAYVPDAENSVTLPLPPGEPNFIVAAVDSAGNASNEVRPPFDIEPPTLTAIALRDTTGTPAAAAGFTNDSDVVLDISATDNSGIVHEAKITGDVEAVLVNGEWLSPVPEFVPFSPTMTIRLGGGASSGDRIVFCQVSDRTGNWSETRLDSILYLNQDMSAYFADGHTLTLAESQVGPDSRVYVPVCFAGNYPEYAWKIITGAKDFARDTLTTLVTPSLCGGANGDFCCNEIPLVVTDEEWRYVKVLDYAGNVSNVDSIYIDIKIPPAVSLTLFDPYDFPWFNSPTLQLPDDWQRSDSLFCGESTYLVALTRLVSGDWDSIRIAPRSPENLRSLPWQPVADSDSTTDLRMVSLPADLDSLEIVTFYVQVKNDLGMADEAFYSIIYDIKPPVLTAFDGARIVSQPEGYRIVFGGADQAPGELAGIIIGEQFDANEAHAAGRAYHYVPITSSEVTISLTNNVGRRTIIGYLVDKADVDQNRVLELQEQIQAEDFTSIDHPSSTLFFETRLNPVEIANYPNPFNPKNEKTYFILPINNAGGSAVRLTILDPFGNLVWEKETAKYEPGLLDGGASNYADLCWDGRNSDGVLVANGGYLCIIDILASGERFMRKIAVIKD